jgi:hypothetical protein
MPHNLRNICVRYENDYSDWPTYFHVLSRVDLKQPHLVSSWKVTKEVTKEQNAKGQDPPRRRSNTHLPSGALDCS